MGKAIPCRIASLERPEIFKVFLFKKGIRKCVRKIRTFELSKTDLIRKVNVCNRSLDKNHNIIIIVYIIRIAKCKYY